MWRIFGICFFSDKDYFVDQENKTFRQHALECFLTERGIGLFDTATEVVRTKNTASDKDLEVVLPTDIGWLLRQAPACHAIATTGQKASELLSSYFNVAVPKVGSFVETIFEGRSIKLYRMPSSSRAYPLNIHKKAVFYRDMFISESLLAF